MATFQKRILLLSVLLFSIVCYAGAQLMDTAYVSRPYAERLFTRNNLRLLAARFNIDAAQAGILQAHLWNNPTIAVEQNTYNQFTSKYFDVTSTGNTEVEVQQLFLLAGKRDKQIRLAEINSRITEQSFYDLLWAVTYELRADFYNLYYLRQALTFYDESISSIRKTVEATERVYEKRAILLSEVLRLKSLLFSLEKERLGLHNQILEKQTSLAVLLNDSTTANKLIIPLVDVGELDSLKLDTIDFQKILALATDRRPDMKIAEESVRFEEANLALQKALGIPDITIGGRWSRAGSYIPDYYALSFSIELPLFKRNQGNILVSENTLEANKRLRDFTKQTVEKEVTTAYQKAREVDTLYLSFDRKFGTQYKQLVGGMIANYEKRSISIIEFTDFFESYRNSMVQMIQLQSDRIQAFEALNYAVGTNIVHP